MPYVHTQAQTSGRLTPLHNVCIPYCACFAVWTLGVWGELACHKRSLTHRPSSQGLAPCVLLLLLVCLFHGMGVSWVSFSVSLLVCYTHIIPCMCNTLLMYTLHFIRLLLRCTTPSLSSSLKRTITVYLK